MKLISRILLISNILISLTITAEASSGVVESFILGARQILLPDGETLYGNKDAVMGEPCFKTTSCTPASMLRTITQLASALKDSRKPETGWFSFSTEHFTPAEVISLYQTLVQEAAALNPEALLFFQIMLRSGEISGFTLPGLQIQPERAKIYDVLYKWRKNFPLTDDEKALLDDVVFLNTSPIYADSVVRKPLTDEATSTMRHRRVNTANDQRAEEKQPLLRPVKAH
jgi:hypothetical protein